MEREGLPLRVNSLGSLFEFTFHDRAADESKQEPISHAKHRACVRGGLAKDE